MCVYYTIIEGEEEKVVGQQRSRWGCYYDEDGCSQSLWIVVNDSEPPFCCYWSFIQYYAEWDTGNSTCCDWLVHTCMCMHDMQSIHTRHMHL